MDGDVTVEVTADVLRAIEESYAMFEEIIALRKDDPEDDLISDLLPAVESGDLAMGELVARAPSSPSPGSRPRST